MPRRKLLAGAIVVVLFVTMVAVLAPGLMHRQQDRPRGEEIVWAGEERPRPVEPSLDRGPAAAEVALWNAVRQADTDALLRQYLRQYLHEYPQGEFVPLAQAKLRGLESQARPSPAAHIGGKPGEPPPPPPPPPPPAPVTEPPAAGPGPADRGDAPEVVTVSRFPTLDAPSEAAVGEEIEVLVALTEEQFTPDVTVRPSGDTTVTADGMLAIADLPASDDGWLLTVDLVAPGFELAEGGAWLQDMQLDPHGDSDYVRYRLRALKIAGEARPARIQARFNLDGRYLGSVSRPVTIVSRPSGGGPASMPATFAAAPMSLGGAIEVIAPEAEVHDLSVVIRYDDPAGLGRAVATFISPHAAPSEEVFSTSPDLPRWLDGEFSRFSAMGAARGATALASPGLPASADPESRRQLAEAVASGVGRQLYENHVPRRFKELFWHLKREGKLRSIQITSNSPAMPWEIVLPVSAEGLPDEFLGVGYRVARWAMREVPGQIDLPRESMAFAGIAAIAPPYDGRSFLPFQQREVDALSRIHGFRRLGGDFTAVRDMLSSSNGDFVHFSGHGELNAAGGAQPVFAIRLADTLLDPATWQAMAPVGAGGPGNFYFFNACDTGRADRLGGFVQGWGPALLQSGASGFIGGMWPLPDRSAAEFSAEFYGRLSQRLGEGPVHLADVLREVRARFHETGDPTYLAYTYYGNANLRVTGP